MTDYQDVLWVILVVIGIIFFIVSIVYIVQLVFAQEWTYDMCVQEFDPVTCDVMFPPIPLESI